MALIVTAHDLSTGNTTSTEVATPNNWTITATVSGAPDRQILFFNIEREDEQGNWSLVRDERDLPVKFSIKGNGSESRNLLLVNGANGRVQVKVPSGSTGTLNIDSINA